MLAACRPIHTARHHRGVKREPQSGRWRSWEKGLRPLREFGEPFILSNHLFELACTYQLYGKQNDVPVFASAMNWRCVRRISCSSHAAFVLAENSQVDNTLREALDWFEAGLEHLDGQGEEPTSTTLLTLAYIAGEASMWSLCASLYSAVGIPWPLEKALSIPWIFLIATRLKMPSLLWR